MSLIFILFFILCFPIHLCHSRPTTYLQHIKTITALFIYDSLPNKTLKYTLSCTHLYLHIFSHVIIHLISTHSINQNNYYMYNYVSSTSIYCRNSVTDYAQKNIDTISDFTNYCYIVMISHVSRPN